MAKETIFDKMNIAYKEKVPYFFVISFDGSKGEVIPLERLSQHNIFFKTKNYACLPHGTSLQKALSWQVKFFPKESYLKQIAAVMREIEEGNTYLLNLTCESEIFTNYNLLEIFNQADARYKLFYKNEFVHFSPEPFLKIKDSMISTYPMKGTINANIENAEMKLRQSTKELHEQYTVVDLMRNDLSIVANNVEVKKFRYVEKIETDTQSLLAASSEISGQLRDAYLTSPGDVFKRILPAGSISGAPKNETLKIIDRVETHKRNFYTGVWGIYDGVSIDSCVIIRYIEEREGKYFYKSGGGIIAESDPEKEYQELKDKIYVAMH